MRKRFPKIQRMLDDAALAGNEAAYRAAESLYVSKSASSEPDAASCIAYVAHCWPGEDLEHAARLIEDAAASWPDWDSSWIDKTSPAAATAGWPFAAMIQRIIDTGWVEARREAVQAAMDR